MEIKHGKLMGLRPDYCHFAWWSVSWSEESPWTVPGSQWESGKRSGLGMSLETFKQEPFLQCFLLFCLKEDYDASPPGPLPGNRSHHLRVWLRGKSPYILMVSRSKSRSPAAAPTCNRWCFRLPSQQRPMPWKAPSSSPEERCKLSTLLPSSCSIDAALLRAR